MSFVTEKDNNMAEFATASATRSILALLLVTLSIRAPAFADGPPEANTSSRHGVVCFKYPGVVFSPNDETTQEIWGRPLWLPSNDLLKAAELAVVDRLKEIDAERGTDFSKHDYFVQYIGCFDAKSEKLIACQFFDMAILAKIARDRNTSEIPAEVEDVGKAIRHLLTLPAAPCDATGVFETLYNVKTQRVNF
jgi:hypothetical protein